MIPNLIVLTYSEIFGIPCELILWIIFIGLGGLIGLRAIRNFTERVTPEVPKDQEKTLRSIRKIKSIYFMVLSSVLIIISLRNIYLVVVAKKIGFRLEGLEFEKVFILVSLFVVIWFLVQNLRLNKEERGMYDLVIGILGGGAVIYLCYLFGLAFLNPSQYQIILTESMDIPAYFTMLITGFTIACIIQYREAIRIGIDRKVMIDLDIWLLVCGVAGARLLHVLVDGFFWDYMHLCTDPFLIEGRELPKAMFSEPLCTSDAMCSTAQERGYNIGAVCNVDTGLCHPEKDCFRALKFWAGGLTIYGGLIGAILFAVIFSTKKKLGFFRIADLSAPGIALALAFGRLGCLLAGCCFGELSNLPWSIHFPAGSQAWEFQIENHYPLLAEYLQSADIRQSMSVHPTQLYSVFMNFGIFIILYFVLRPRKRFNGYLFWWLVILYSSTRFLVEYIRSDYRGEIGWFSTSQFISLPVFVIALVMLFFGVIQANKKAKNVS